MISTKTLKERESKYNYLRHKKDELEMTEGVKNYFRWEKLATERQASIKKEWDEYFAKVRQGSAYLNYAAMKEAFKTNNIAEVRDRAKWASELRKQEPEVKKPTSFPVDPEMIKVSSEFLAYRSVLQALKELEPYQEQQIGAGDL